jgi:putative transposase
MENETGMHSCLDSKPKLAGWPRRPEDGYYENGAEPGRGYRNGHRHGRLRTAEGAIEFGVPQVADREEPSASRVRPGLAGRTAELEQPALEMYARGLSTRDIEAAFRDASGGSVLSRTAVS